MKRKILSISVIIIFVLLTIYNSISLATSGNNEESFISVYSTDVELGDDLLINVNMDKIDYENFKIVVTSSIQMDGVTITDDSINGAEVSVDNNEEMTLTGNKSTMNVNQVTLQYVIPDNVTAGSKIVITAKLINADDETVESINKEITINVIEKQTNNNTGNNTISDNTGTNIGTGNSNIGQDTQNGSQSIGMSVTQMTGTTMAESQISSNTKLSSSSQAGISALASGSNSVASQEETVVYNGSSNNYLSALFVSGYNLNTDFSKTNSTYFITAKDTSSLDITATAEESTSTVKIYGESELKEGTNKILISVTAENGNVRTYRVYVTIEG